MAFVFNILYGTLLLLALPYLAWRSWRTGRYRRGIRDKLFGLRKPLYSTSPPVWLHGVSVGEIHLLRTVIAAFRERFPGVPIVVSATTDGGLEEARKAFPDDPVIAWPLDFSWAVERTLRAVGPRAVVLAESELWPNFLAAAERRGIPVLVVNGRMSPRSSRRAARFGSLAKTLLFGKVARFGMQSDEYADNLKRIGIPTERIAVTGSVKYDGALRGPDAAAARLMKEEMGIGAGERVLVAGSTHAPEEEIALRVYRNLRDEFSDLRLVIVPRSPDRFAAVANLIEAARFSLRRRSDRGPPSKDAVLHIDTLGELSAAWGFADIAFVGGSFDGRRGGQSMIEPAGYGVPSIFGPHVWNFRAAAEGLTACGGAVKVASPEELERQLRLWLGDEKARQLAGRAAREFVARQQGAAARTLDLIGPFISSASPAAKAA